VINTANLQPGQNIVVFGAGGIGLCSVAVAAVLRANQIAAIDLRPERLELARRLGATHTIDASAGDVLQTLRQLCPGGWDAAIEATGQPPVMQTALAAVRPRGGSAIVVGNAKFGETLTIDPREFNQGKRLLGTWGGDTSPDRDFPKYCEWIASGTAAVEQVLDREYGLANVTEALHDLHAGRCTRPVINLNR
jgi:S-(hydroxymethyl)glutathione dehydrogenase/alcohol dehydrogenase